MKKRADNAFWVGTDMNPNSSSFIRHKQDCQQCETAYNGVSGFPNGLCEEGQACFEQDKTTAMKRKAVLEVAKYDAESHEVLVGIAGDGGEISDVSHMSPEEARSFLLDNYDQATADRVLADASGKWLKLGMVRFASQFVVTMTGDDIADRAKLNVMGITSIQNDPSDVTRYIVDADEDTLADAGMEYWAHGAGEDSVTLPKEFGQNIAIGDTVEGPGLNGVGKGPFIVLDKSWASQLDNYSQNLAMKPDWVVIRTVDGTGYNGGYDCCPMDYLKKIGSKRKAEDAPSDVVPFGPNEQFVDGNGDTVYSGDRVSLQGSNAPMTFHSINPEGNANVEIGPNSLTVVEVSQLTKAAEQAPAAQDDTQENVETRTETGGKKRLLLLTSEGYRLAGKRKADMSFENKALLAYHAQSCEQCRTALEERVPSGDGFILGNQDALCDVGKMHLRPLTPEQSDMLGLKDIAAQLKRTAMPLVKTAVRSKTPFLDGNTMFREA